MAAYKYKVSDQSGKVFDFIAEGDNQQDALRRLRTKGFVPLHCYGESSATADGGKRKLSRLFEKKSKFNVHEFIDRLVPLLRAHIQLERALGIMSTGTQEATQKEVIDSLRSGLHEGKKLSELIRSKPQHFPSICANLTEAGEESGALIEVMNELKRFLDYKKETRDFIVTSSIYPCIILGVTVAVILLLFTVFVPKFTQIFANMGQKLPLPTEIMFGISHMFTNYWFLWVALVAVVSFAIIKIRTSPKGRMWWDKKILSLPIFGEIITTMETGQFINTLAVLIKNNVHLVTTVTISSRVIENKEISQSLTTINTDLKGGLKLSKALSKSPYIPRLVIQMLEVGEESGDMGGMLGQVSEYLEKEMKLKIKRLLALFEPVTILVLAGVVFLVVVSIFLAIMQMSNISGQ